MGSKVIFIALAESFGAFLLVFLVSYTIQGDAGLAILLGTDSIATAPGVTLMVTREYHARGPLTDTLLAVVALNNVICLLRFQLFFAGFWLVRQMPAGEVIWALA